MCDVVKIEVCVGVFVVDFWFCGGYVVVCYGDCLLLMGEGKGSC